MPVQIKKIANGLELGGERLCIRLDFSEGALHLARVDGSIKFGPIVFWAEFEPKPEDRKFLFSTVVRLEEPELLEEKPTPFGNAAMVKWPVSLAGLRFVWETAFFPEQEFAAFRLKMENQNRQPGRVWALSPFSFRGAGDGLEMGAGYTVWKFYRLGYQSWSPAGSIDFQEPQPKAKNFLARWLGLAPYLWNRQAPWVWSSEWMAEIVEPELDLAVLLGFATSRSQTGVVEAEVKYERFRRFEAIADCEGMELSAGESLHSEWVLAMLTDAPRGGQKKYFELWAKAMNARPAKPLTGWCSWYYYFAKIDQPSFEQNLAEAKKLNPGIELFQLDEGYESRVGDWLCWNHKFPSRPEELAGKIRDHGFKAGIWLAPFLAARGSRLFREHRNWFLKTGRGNPVPAMVNPNFKGLLAYALDATHPEFQNWLKELVRKLVHDFGLDYLKLDFIYAASLYGKRYDPKATGASALRRGLELIREAAGDRCCILGCGSPLGPAIGLLDAMRVSQDTDRKWKNLLDTVFGIRLAPSMQSCLGNDISRALTASRLWTLDPDCLVLSRGKNLSDWEIKSQLVVFYLLGGQLLLSEDLARLDEEQLRLFSLASPVSSRPAEPIDLFDREFPQELFLAGSPMSLLALFNWSEESKPARLNLARYGLKGRFHVFEFFSREYLGEMEGRNELGKIPPHGVKYLALTELSDKPSIVGLDFHLGMGWGYAQSEFSGGSGKISIALPGRRSGNIFLKFPSEKTMRALPVDFQDLAKMNL